MNEGELQHGILQQLLDQLASQTTTVGLAIGTGREGHGITSSAAQTLPPGTSAEKIRAVKPRVLQVGTSQDSHAKGSKDSVDLRHDCHIVGQALRRLRSNVRAQPQHRANFDFVG